AWMHVAARFKDHPWVLGYDLMNEPFAGSVAAGNFGGILYGDPRESKHVEETLFRGFYDRTSAAIRSADANAWIVDEPLAFPVNNGGPSYLGKLADPRHGENRLVYFPHLYAIVPEASNHFDPHDTPELDAWTSERRMELPALRVP